MTTRLGFIALARTTFDIPLAEQSSLDAFRALDQAEGVEMAGGPGLATDINSTSAAARALQGTELDAVVVFQATFADTTLVKAVANALDVPLVLWATTEPRTGERLRLNSFCGINLAAHALAREGVDFRWSYRNPSDPKAVDDVLEAVRTTVVGVERAATTSDGSEIDLSGTIVGLVGTRPDGFEPCEYDPQILESLFGVRVEAIPIQDWFEEAGQIDSRRVAAVRSTLESEMSGIEDVDQHSLSRSLELYLGLSDIVRNRGWSGAATRCWPECFTEFGGAACGGNSMLASAGTPGTCEADVYGNVTSLLLQEVAGAPAFVADLVDMDRDTNTVVFWHCGMAPWEMAASEPSATVHSNRQKPLLNEFALRAGRVTIARISQARGVMSLVVGGGEMLHEPLPFSGTSGVATLDSGVESALATIMSEGLEHHYGIVYGDHTQALSSYAGSVGLPVIEL